MKKGNGFAFAIGMCGVSLAVHAQSTVQVYGSADIGVEYLSRVEGKGAVMRLPTLTGGQMASRLGFRGSEDLGNGLKANFVLETGLSLTDGGLLQSGRGFGRQSYVGLSGKWGAISLGRQNTMGLLALAGVDPIGPAVFGLSALNQYIPNTRFDHSIGYQRKFGRLLIGGLYSKGRDAKAPSNCGPDSGSACDAFSAIAKYDAGHWGVSLAHDRLKGNEGSRFFGQPSGMTVSNRSRDDYTFLTGYKKFAQTRIGMGVIRRQLRTNLETYRSNQYFLGASHTLSSQWVLDGVFTYLDANRAQADAQLLSMRLNFNLSKRTALYALLGHVRNQKQVGYSVSGGGSVVPASPGLGKGQSGMMLGMRHTF